MIMAFRSRTYYHPSQVKTNLFTNGKEWMILENWKEYIGPYHQYVTGETYSETEWDPRKSVRLVKYKDRGPSYFKYVQQKNYAKNPDGTRKPKLNPLAKFDLYTKPIPIVRIPTEDELNEGKMTRHFAYKRNEPNIFFVEISPNQTIDYYRDHTGINRYLYEMIDVPWKINGPEYDQLDSNGYLVNPGVVDTNNRIILRITKKVSIFGSIVNNPRQFTIYDTTLKLV